jgi:general secretion pathway protein D
MKPLIIIVAAMVLLAGCASSRHFDEGSRLSAAGQSDAALAELEKAVAEEPRNSRYRAALLRERERVVNERIVAGDGHARADRLEEAEAQYRAALRADPGDARAQARVNDVANARQWRVLMAEARASFGRNDLLGAEARLRSLLSESPQYPGARDLLRRVLEASAAMTPAPVLKVPLARPVTLEFKDAPLRSVFDLMARSSGINFVFDRDVRQDVKLSVHLRNTRLEDALKLILATQQLDHKALNENSVVIYPNTPAKQKDYRELAVRSYYLGNADVKQSAALIKAMAKTQDVFIDEKLNLMVVKDTPEVLRLVDQLVRTIDLAEPEVMLEVEVLEITRSRLQDLGVRWPSSVSLGAQEATGAISTAATVAVDSPMMFTTANPALVFNLRANVSKTDLLANPRIRVRNKEKARIHIGDKVPVFTTTAAANVGVATSVTYLDVGLKLDVEPLVTITEEVAIKVALEVSNIVETISVGAGTAQTVAYRLGTRNTATALQMRDGQTQILAGLISDEDRRSSQRVPGLGDLPVLGRLFGTENTNKVKTEIVLLITPRIVRNVARPEGVMAELPMGTDTMPGVAPLRIGRTAPGSLAIGPGGPAGAPEAARTDPDIPPLTDQVFAMSMTAPAEVARGAVFGVQLGLPEALEIRDGSVELSYDPAVLEPLGAPARSPGRLQVAASGMSSGAEVRFRVIGAPSSQSALAVSAMQLVDQTGDTIRVTPPPALTVTVAR